MFGFAGAHRTGKTTLAKAVCETLDIPFLDFSVSKTMREGGFDGVSNLPMLERMAAQHWVLDRYIEAVANAPRPCITDRTPLDMIGYMLGEVTMHNTDEEQGVDISNYVTRCLVETARSFDSIIIARPLTFYAPDPKSPPANVGYQAAVQFIIEGAMQQLPDHILEFKLCTDDFEERHEACCEVIAQRLDAMDEARKAARLN